MLRFERIIPLLLFVLFLQTGLASGQSGDFSQIDEIQPYDSELSVEEFFANSVIHEETPKGDQYLAYSLRLPEDWVKVEGDFTSDNPANGSVNKKSGFFMGEKKGAGEDVFLSRRILGNIGTYRGPAIGMVEPSRFYIKAVELESSVTARNWFLGYVLSNGYILKGLNSISDKRVEGLYIILEDGETYAVRLVVEINGPRAVLAMYYLPAYRFNEERALQQHVMGSFTLTSPEQGRFNLRKRTYNFFNTLYFDYPSMWQSSEVGMDSIDVMEVILVNADEEGNLNGEIRFSAVSTEMDTELSEEVKYAQGKLKKKGLKIDSFIESVDHFDLHDHIYFHRVEAYKTKGIDKDIIDYEYWVAAMEESRYYYVVTMITPARETNFFRWIQNTEAFETILETTRP